MIAFPLMLLLAVVPGSPRPPVLDGITFSAHPGAIYLPISEICRHLGYKLEFDPVTEIARVNGAVHDVASRRLHDGSWLASLDTVLGWGARTTVTARGATVMAGNKGFSVRVAPKRVAIDMTKQEIRGWQGDRLVFYSAISTGREGHETPPGSFRTGKKERMHISSIYGSEMPWSVHVSGNIFIHGSKSFYYAPGSHGCIRLPLHGRRDEAEWFYSWIDEGVPVRITGRWREPKGG